MYKQKDSDLPKTRRELVALIFKIAFLEAMALSIILPSVTSSGEIPVSCNGSIGTIVNNTCPAIIFDTTSSSGVVSICPCKISASITATTGDIIVVATSSENQSNAATINVTSVVDTQSDNFTLRIHTYIKNTIFCCSSDMWTAIMSQQSTTVTVTYQNLAGGPFALSLILSTYKNTNSVGTTGFTCGGASPSSQPPCVIQAKLGNFTIVPQKTGSVIVGSTTIESGNTCTINIIPGNNQTQRSQQCTVSPDSMTMDIEDNLQASYLNGFQFFYSSSFPDPVFSVEEFTINAIELRPLFNGANNNVASPSQCTKANQLCNLIVANKNSGVQTTQLISANTEYCTGITTVGMIINKTSNIQFNAMYGLDDRNVTNGVVRVILYFSNSVPSTTFGVGACGSSASSVAEARLVFGTAGTGTSTSIFAIYTTLTRVVNINTSLGSTFYAWIDIIPFSNMSILQFGTTPQSSISMVMLSGQ